MDGLVQQSRQTHLDTRAANHWHYLADHLPDHPGQLRRRARAVDSRKSSGNRRPPVRDQLSRESTLYSDSVRHAESATRRARHRDRLGNDHLVRGRHLALHEMGRHRASPLFRLGLDRHLAAALDHHPQLGQITNDSFGLVAARSSQRAALRLR